MQFPRPPEGTAIAGLRALKSVAIADGEMHALERAYIDAVRDHILQLDVAIESLDTIDGGALAEAVPDMMFRERIIRGAIILALMDGAVCPEEEVVIDAYARALGTDSVSHRTFKRIAHDRIRALKIDIIRRGFIGKRLAFQYRQKGLRGLKEAIDAIRQKENIALRDRYLALEHKPQGTLGHAYWAFTRANGFSFPGEVGGPPEPLVFHDCVHVLADYGTSVPEEANVVAFQSGLQNYDPFHSLLFVIAQFHLGIAVSPVAGSETMGLHDLDQIVKCFLLGTECNRDLSDGWDPWVDFDTPVEELRERYNIRLRPESWKTQSAD